MEVISNNSFVVWYKLTEPFFKQIAESLFTQITERCKYLMRGEFIWREGNDLSFCRFGIPYLCNIDATEDIHENSKNGL